MAARYRASLERGLRYCGFPATVGRTKGSRQLVLTNPQSSTYIDAMANEAALAEAASGQDPAAGLRAARALRELAERLEALQVQNARRHGWSWQEIAFFLGVSKQAVHKKYAHALTERLDRRSRGSATGGPDA